MERFVDLHAAPAPAGMDNHAPPPQPPKQYSPPPGPEWTTMARPFWTKSWTKSFLLQEHTGKPTGVVVPAA